MIMKNRLFKKTELLFILICADFYLMGIIFHSIDFTAGLMKPVTPFVLLIFGAYLLYAIRQSISRKTLIIILILYLFTFTLEALGVATGMVFGEYYYGDTLGMKVFEVPLVIGFNWVLIIYGLYSAAAKIFSGNGWLNIFIVSAGAVVFDYVMEPAAIGLKYWTWTDGVIPLQNYIAWFIIAFICAAVFKLAGTKTAGYLPAVYVAIQSVFFILLRIIVL